MSSLRKLAGVEVAHDESCGNDVEDELELVLEDNPGTTGTNFLSCAEFSHFGSDVAFNNWPTHRYDRVLRRACQMTGRQACHRVFVPSRRVQDRELIPVLPHLFALPHWL